MLDAVQPIFAAVNHISIRPRSPDHLTATTVIAIRVPDHCWTSSALHGGAPQQRYFRSHRHFESVEPLISDWAATSIERRGYSDGFFRRHQTNGFIRWCCRSGYRCMGLRTASAHDPALQFSAQLNLRSIVLTMQHSNKGRIAGQPRTDFLKIKIIESMAFCLISA